MMECVSSFFFPCDGLTFQPRMKTLLFVLIRAFTFSDPPSVNRISVYVGLFFHASHSPVGLMTLLL